MRILYNNIGRRYGQTYLRYDYGRTKNQQLYGQPTPTAYDLSKVTCPVYIFWGKNDKVSLTSFGSSLYKPPVFKKIPLFRSLLQGYVVLNNFKIIITTLIFLGYRLVGIKIRKLESFKPGGWSIMESWCSSIFTGRQKTCIWQNHSTSSKFPLLM